MDEIGLPRGVVRLVPYRTEWAKHFEQEATVLSKLLDLPIKEIHHVGSTSIPGISAKPIIDILIVYAHLPNLNDITTILGNEGYSYRENGSTTMKYFFAKGSPDKRTHYLHITSTEAPNWQEQLIFRNALREDLQLRREYQQLKTELGTKYSDNRSEYTIGKTTFIKKIINH